MSNNSYILRYIDFQKNPELANTNPQEQGWYEYESATVNGTYVQGYIIPSNDTVANTNKTYYDAPEKE